MPLSFRNTDPRKSPSNKKKKGDMVVLCCVVLCGTSIMKEEQEKHHDMQEAKVVETIDWLGGFHAL
jgi:hypothetical protein